MRTIVRPTRKLLAAGNDKLGKSVFHFDLPAGITCPGKTSCCDQVCYAKKGRFVFDYTRKRFEWLLKQSRQKGFVSRIVREIRETGVLLVRLHVSGDFYSAAYAKKWLSVVRKCPHVKFYCYTRSWRLPAIAAVLEQLAACPNCRVWYSTDRETGSPAKLPPNVRTAYLQDTPKLHQNAPLIFRTQPMRTSLPVLKEVCPVETPVGKKQGVNCTNCARCWE